MPETGARRHQPNAVEQKFYSLVRTLASPVVEPVREWIGRQIDKRTVALDGSEMIMTIGQAKQDLGPLLRMNAEIMARGIKAVALPEGRELTDKEKADRLLADYMRQLERHGEVVVIEPTGMAKFSMRKVPS